MTDKIRKLSRQLSCSWPLVVLVQQQQHQQESGFFRARRGRPASQVNDDPRLGAESRGSTALIADDNELELNEIFFSVSAVVEMMSREGQSKLARR